MTSRENTSASGEGFWRLSHDDLKALLRLRVTDYERRVYLALGDLTRGYAKERDIIGAGQIAHITGISRPHVHHALRALESKGLATREKLTPFRTLRGVTWPPPSASLGTSASPGTTSSASAGTISSAPAGTHQETRKKRTPLTPSPKRTTQEAKGGDTPQVVFEAWNAQALKHRLPRARILDAKRKRLLNQHLANADWRASWREALTEIPRKPFLMGENDRGWKANFPFSLRLDSVMKILEGSYDGNGQATNPFKAIEGAYCPKTNGGGPRF